MEGPKLEWMYRDSNETVDREEYLLGRPIDKAFEQSSFSNEIEKDCLPTSIFANAGSTIQVDVIRKLKEDPLEIIRQQEIDRRKQLLKNPVKLKKLQNMLKTKENDVSMKSTKSSEKKKNSDANSSDIDKLLASKYLKIMKKHGIKSLSELSNIKLEKKHKSSSKKHRKSVSEDSSSSSDSESDEEYSRKHKEESRKKHDHKSGSSRDFSKKHLHSSKTGNSYRSKEQDKHFNERNSYKHGGDKKSPTRTLPEKHNSDRNRRPDKEKVPDHSSNKRDISVGHRSRSDMTNSTNKKQKSNSLSENEKQKRLNEMMENAKWRDDVRSKNIARYKKEEASEKVENYSEDFLRKQMREMIMATSNKSVESRIKSNINNIQKSKLTMNENFIKR